MTKGKFLLVFLTLAVLLTACAGKASSGISVAVHTPSVPDVVRDYPPEPVSGKTAHIFFRDEKILSGWNLGNTLDSHSGGYAGETTWGNPSVNQDLMNGVKAAGFDIIRIPVTWMGYIRGAPDYFISAHRIERVAEVVDMAHNAGLKVIINIHHDGSSPREGMDEGWLSIRRSSRNAEEYNRITQQFSRLWEQIAAYFKNYGDWLMFESMNEIHDGGWCWSNDFKMFPGVQWDILNKWNQIFTDKVRASGGNNAERYLVIPAYCTKPDQTLSDLFILPKDSISGRQIVTFHYYDPNEFGINGTRISWGTQNDKQRVTNDFAPFKERFVDRNIPVIIGECGAVLQLYPNDAAKEAQARQSRLDYIPYVYATAKRYGLVPFYWDNGTIRGNGEKFGLFDRRTGLPNSPDSSVLIKAMINAVQ